MPRARAGATPPRSARVTGHTARARLPLYLPSLALSEVRAAPPMPGPQLAVLLAHPSIVLGQLDAGTAAQGRPAAPRRRGVGWATAAYRRSTRSPATSSTLPAAAAGRRNQAAAKLPRTNAATNEESSPRSRRQRPPFAGRRRVRSGCPGVAGSVACTAAMVAPVIGALGAGAAASTGGMTGMTGPTQGGLLGFLIEYGPITLGASIVLVTVSLAWPRSAAAPRSSPSSSRWRRQHRPARALPDNPVLSTRYGDTWLLLSGRRTHSVWKVETRPTLQWMPRPMLRG